MSVTRWSAPPFTRRTASPRRVWASAKRSPSTSIPSQASSARLLLVLVARPPGQPELTVAHVGRAQRGVCEHVGGIDLLADAERLETARPGNSSGR